MMPNGDTLGWQYNDPNVDEMRRERDWYRAREEELLQAVNRALAELGVPTGDYPAPVTNAVTILAKALTPTSVDPWRCSVCGLPECEHPPSTHPPMESMPPADWDLTVGPPWPG